MFLVDLITKFIDDDHILCRYFRVHRSSIAGEAYGFITLKPVGRNVCWISESLIGYMNPKKPIPSVSVQTQADWIEADPADPDCFPNLRAYLLECMRSA